MPALRRAADSEDRGRVSTLELFYDLVFVFAITQVSHLLLADLTWTGAAQTLLVLLVIWWSWNFTTWATNELDPESNRVRLLLILLMLLSLTMAIAIPEAFGDHALLFAGSYVAIQVTRQAFLTYVAGEPGSLERERAFHILVWFAVAAPLWLVGAVIGDETQTVLWVAAVLIDYGGPLCTFWLPGRRVASEAWEVEPSHMAERFQLFVIIALGETIVITGATTADLPITFERVLALATAFLGTAALWWLYFGALAERVSLLLAGAEGNRTMVARDIYTYLHVVLVAGIVVSAVGDEIVIAHPDYELKTAGLLALTGGPVLYVLAQDLMRLRGRGEFSATRTAGIFGCVAVGLLGIVLPALATSALLVVVLGTVIVASERLRRPVA